MVTAEQIRAGRAAIGWSAEQLSNAAGIVRRTLVAIESQSGVPSANARTIQNVRSALEEAGIEFVAAPGDGPGIRVRKSSRS